MAPAEDVITHRLTKRYGKDILAVEDVDCRSGEGGVRLPRPERCGQGQHLRMLLGLICPTSGTAVVAEHRPGDPAGLAQIGSLVESPAFYRHLSGRENLPVVATYAGVPQSRVDPHSRRLSYWIVASTSSAPSRPRVATSCPSGCCPAQGAGGENRRSQS